MLGLCILGFIRKTEEKACLLSADFQEEKKKKQTQDESGYPYVIVYNQNKEI